MLDLIAKLRTSLGLHNGNHARLNLSGAIHDADHGVFDRVCIKTMKRVERQLADVEDILDAAEKAALKARAHV